MELCTPLLRSLILYLDSNNREILLQCKHCTWYYCTMVVIHLWTSLWPWGLALFKHFLLNKSLKQRALPSTKVFLKEPKMCHTVCLFYWVFILMLPCLLGSCLWNPVASWFMARKKTQTNAGLRKFNILKFKACSTDSLKSLENLEEG